MTDVFEKKCIKIRLEDTNEQSGYIFWSGYLVSDTLAIAVLSNCVELHQIKPTSEESVYDFVFSSDSLFEVEQGREQEAVDDLSRLTFAEFVEKYPYLGFSEED